MQIRTIITMKIYQTNTIKSKIYLSIWKIFFIFAINRTMIIICNLKFGNYEKELFTSAFLQEDRIVFTNTFTCNVFY